jgi:hypothetical protein
MLGEPPVRQLAQVSLHLTEYVRLFGEYSGHELADEPDAYGPYLISITPIRVYGPPTGGFRRGRVIQRRVAQAGRVRVGRAPDRARRYVRGVIAGTGDHSSRSTSLSM